MIRLRTSFTFEFDTSEEIAELYYDTTDPEELAQAFLEQFREEPGSWYDLTNEYINGTEDFSVEPVE